MDHRRLIEIKKMSVNFRKDLGYRCPVCQKIILPTDDDGFLLHPTEDRVFKVSPCPHLVWCNTVEDNNNNKYGDWAFMFVRSDITRKIIKLIEDDSVFKQLLKIYGVKVSSSDISLFLSGKFELEDRISCVFANLPLVYEQLLPPNTSIFYYSYSEFSSIEFAIEDVSLN